MERNVRWETEVGWKHFDHSIPSETTPDAGRTGFYLPDPPSLRDGLSATNSEQL